MILCRETRKEDSLCIRRDVSSATETVSWTVSDARLAFVVARMKKKMKGGYLKSKSLGSGNAVGTT